MYPGKQEHAKLPSELVQWANTSHGRYLHSFSSIDKQQRQYYYILITTPVVRPSVEHRRPVWDAPVLRGRTLAWHLARTSSVSVVAVTQRVETGAVLTGRPFFGLAIICKKMDKKSSNNLYVSTTGKQRTTVTRGKHGARLLDIGLL